MKKIILIAIILVAFSNSYAAQRIVSGKVFLNNKFALGNIVVNAKKSQATVSTNNDGEFSIACEDNDILFFKAAPFNVVRKSVKNKDYLEVKMSFKKGKIDQNKVVDLGFMKVEDMKTFAKTSKKPDNDFSDYVNIFDVISRELPHVTMTPNGFLVRGKNSMLGNNAALIVVDGQQMVDVSHIRPADVESVNLLVGTSAAIYGSRGANGVIVIKTKLGAK